MPKKPAKIIEMKKRHVVDPPLSRKELRSYVRRMFAIKARIKDQQKRFTALEVRVIATLGIHGLFQSDQFRCLVVQSRQRKIKWREVAMSIAKTHYGKNKMAFRRWLRELVKAHPKQKCKPFAKLTVQGEKDTEEATEETA